MISKKIFLVTGGAGFIGSHLCEWLAKDPSHMVYSLDNYFTGTELNHVPNVIYIKGDTRNIADLINFSPDFIFHLGEYSRVEQSYDDIETVWASNKDGTFAVLEFALKSSSCDHLPRCERQGRCFCRWNEHGNHQCWLKAMPRNCSKPEALIHCIQVHKQPCRSHLVLVERQLQSLASRHPVGLSRGCTMANQAHTSRSLRLGHQNESNFVWIHLPIARSYR